MLPANFFEFFELKIRQLEDDLEEIIVQGKFELSSLMLRIDQVRKQTERCAM